MDDLLTMERTTSLLSGDDVRETVTITFDAQTRSILSWENRSNIHGTETLDRYDVADRYGWDDVDEAGSGLVRIGFS